MRRGLLAATSIWAVGSLAGCPLILGGPDLSNVDAEASDSGPTTPDTEPTEPTEEVDPLAPLIVEADVVPLVDALGFSFVVADSDGDLVGGTLAATDGAVSHELGIPQDLIRFNENGVSSATVDAEDLFDCDRPYVGAWDLVITDLSGRPSPPYSGEVELKTRGTLPQQTGPYDLGEIEPPTLFCVQFDGLTYGERKPVRFTVPQSGSYTLHFGWPDQPMDGDLNLYVVGNQYALGSSAAVGNQYETVSADLDAGTTYRAELWYYGGTGPPPHTGRVVIRRNP